MTKILTSRQRAHLRALGNALEPVFQVGKAGVTDELLRQLDDVLEARELIKVRVLKNAFVEPDAVAEQVCEHLGGDLIQKIGRNFLLFRPSQETKIVLP